MAKKVNATDNYITITSTDPINNPILKTAAATAATVLRDNPNADGVLFIEGKIRHYIPRGRSASKA